MTPAFFFFFFYFYIYSKFPFLFNNFLLSFEDVETFGGDVIFCANLCCCSMKKVLFPFQSSMFYSFKYSYLLSSGHQSAIWMTSRACKPCIGGALVPIKMAVMRMIVVEHKYEVGTATREYFSFCDLREM
ncbi:unnamed protein product [Ixodes pacificus]